jgi:molybdopterin synthase catalytic subunit
MRVELRDDAFDPLAELARYQSEALAGRTDFGALASFIGTMRDFNEGETVSAMTLEHYPGMTEAHLRRISEEAARRWEILETLVSRSCWWRPGRRTGRRRLMPAGS